METEAARHSVRMAEDLFVLDFDFYAQGKADVTALKTMAPRIQMLPGRYLF